VTEITKDDTIDIGDRAVLRFFPTHKKIKDGIPRCISCGQIDEPEYHESAYCPGAGGALPFPTSTLKMNLKADSGFRSESSQRITLEQWRLINIVLSGGASISLPIVDQDGKNVGTANVEVADMFKVEAFMDEEGTVWTPPTALAYRAACKAPSKAA
jgi:hypothetical protein